jgi:hypothetical protein
MNSEYGKEQFMETIPKSMFEVNDIVKRYSNLHNGFFKSSWLKFIPGLAKPIDYGHHFKNLSGLSERLQGIENALKEDNEFESPFGNYVHALLETVLFLQGMSQKLLEKSRGASDYTDQAYRDDTDKYNKLAADFRSLAAVFNKTLAMD